MFVFDISYFHIGISICRISLHFCRISLHFFTERFNMAREKTTRCDNPHVLIHFILERCKPTRVAVAKELKKSRQTLADWEYQRVQVRDYMIEEVAAAANYPMHKIPEQIMQRHMDVIINGPKQREVPRDIKAPEPIKRPPVDNTKKPPEWCLEKNYGKPTARNSNPKTFGAGMNASKGIAIPSDADYPDMRHLMTEKLPPYELVQVPQHYVPYLGADSGVISIGPAWVFKDAQGKRWFYINKADALRTVEERRKIDTISANTVDDLI